MSVTISLHPGVRLVEGDRLTITTLMNMWDLGYATLDSGTINTTNVANQAITVAKMATVLDLSSNTVTLPANLMPVTSIDSAPDYVGQIAVVSGVEYVAHGTAAVTDWERMGPAITNIDSAPDRVGDIAIVGNKLYYATGVVDADDWISLNTNYVVFTEQDDDIAVTADTVTLYCKDSGSQMDLYYRRGSGGAQQLTGVVGSGMNSEGSPDWDSGWTLCNKATVYDLTSTAANAFSDTATKGNNVTGATDAGSVLDFVEYRQAKLMVKKAGAGPFADFLTFIGQIPFSYNSYGAILMTQGGTFGVFDNSSPDGDIEFSSAKLYLRTGNAGIVLTRMSTAGDVLDWDEQTNYALGDTADECLVRIQLWQ